MADRLRRPANGADNGITDCAGVGIYELSLAAGSGPWSAAAFHILGLKPPSDGVGQMAWLQAVIHPDDRTQVLEEFSAAAAALEPWRRDVRIIRAQDTAIRWVSLSACFTETGSSTIARGVMVDVSTQYRLEAELRECQDRLKGLADNLPGGVVFQSVFTNGVPNIIYMSDNSERVIGIPGNSG